MSEPYASIERLYEQCRVAGRDFVIESEPAESYEEEAEEPKTSFSPFVITASWRSPGGGWTSTGQLGLGAGDVLILLRRALVLIERRAERELS